MQLINEQNYVLILCKLIKNPLDTLLELSAILRPGYERCHIKRHNAFVEKYTRHLAFHYSQRKPFDNGRFSDTGLTDEHRVVLLAAAEDLCKTLYLHISADHRVQTVLLGCLCHVIAIFIEHRCIGISSAATAMRLP